LIHTPAFTSAHHLCWSCGRLLSFH